MFSDSHLAVTFHVCERCLVCFFTPDERRAVKLDLWPSILGHRLDRIFSSIVMYHSLSLVIVVLMLFNLVLSMIDLRVMCFYVFMVFIFLFRLLFMLKCSVWFTYCLSTIHVWCSYSELVMCLLCMYTICGLKAVLVIMHQWLFCVGSFYYDLWVL